MFVLVGRRWLAVAGVSAVGLAGGVAVAAASGGGTPKLVRVPTALSLRQQAAAFEAKLAAHAGPRASATVAGHAATIACGQTITATTTLTEDLNCAGKEGIVIGANNITLNLNGHFINGSFDVNDSTAGVIDMFNTDTIENGYVHGFTVGVVAGGNSDTVTKLQVNATLHDGIELAGFNGDKATSNTAAENFGTGIFLDGFAQTAQSNHLLNNGTDGLDAIGGADKVLDNIADGNTGEGIHVGSLRPTTVTGNTANYNTDYGIHALSPQIDGGTNTAKGNTNPRQCYGVVCS